MRQRRIDRLIARADTAIAEGRPADAREPLEELELLDPRSPQLAELRAQANAPVVQPVGDLDLRPASEVPQEPSARRRWPWVTAAMLAIGVGAWFAAPGIRVPDALRAAIAPDPTPSVPVTTAVEDVASSSLPPVQVAVDDVPATSTVAEPPPAEGTDESAAASAVPPVTTSTPIDVSTAPAAVSEENRALPEPPQTGAASESERPAPPTPRAEDAPTRAEPTVARTEPQRTEPAPRRTEPAAVREPTDSRSESTLARTEPTTGRLDPVPAVSAPPRLPEVTSPLPPKTAPERSIAPPPTVAAPAPAAPATSSASEAAPPARAAADDAGVRSTLAQYESAYSRLDVDAARAVWPGLDRRALARAFDGLSAQRIDLGTCDVRLVAETAMAECRGSATWTPKVGGGSHTQQRRWQFRLRQAPSGWQIVSAMVR
jgi:hypothetical protein